jgi:hypothetical protein
MIVVECVCFNVNKYVFLRFERKKSWFYLLSAKLYFSVE